MTEVKIVFFESHYPKAENENGNKIMICVVVKNYWNIEQEHKRRRQHEQQQPKSFITKNK